MIRFTEILLVVRIVVLSLTYNAARPLTSAVLMKSSTLPLFWMFARAVKMSGPLFVVGVVILVSAVVGTVYVYIVPYHMERSYVLCTIYIVVGHWLLANIVFHYYKGVTAKPGAPPKMSDINERPLRRHWKICHKCMQLKAPRTHHCSICKRCVLKMDHHCPWINNCIGHFTHRYFFLFCVYMTMGTGFVVWINWNVFSELFFTRQQIPRSFSTLHPPPDDDPIQRKSVIAVTLLCAAAACTVGSLTMWHAYLISLGETSIEFYINREEERRYQKKGFVYTNPYDHGIKKNWKLFLGLANGRDWRHILWPSSHRPIGNGLEWDTSSYVGATSRGDQPLSNGLPYAHKPPSTYI